MTKCLPRIQEALGSMSSITKTRSGGTNLRLQHSGRGRRVRTSKSQLHSKFGAGLGWMRHCQKERKKKGEKGGREGRRKDGREGGGIIKRT